MRDHESSPTDEARFLQSVFDSIRDGISVLDADLNIVQVNAWMEAMYADHRPLAGNKCYAVYQHRDSACRSCPSLRSLDDGQPHTEVVPYPSADAPQGWLELFAYPLHDPDGEVVGVIEHVKDVSDRVRAEQALQQSEAHYRLLFESASDALFLHQVDPDGLPGRLTQVNQVACDRLGYSREELLELTVADLDGPDSPADVPAVMERLEREGFALFRTVHQAKDGRQIPVEVSAHQFELDGEPTVLSVVRDIGERLAAEEALSESHQRYRAIVEAFDGLIYICSPDYRVEFMNQQFIERTGRDATGEPCYEALHDLDEICPWCVNEQVQRGETVRWEVKSPKDGRWFYVVNTPIHHADGTISKQAMIQDITERKEAAERTRLSERRFRAFFENEPDYCYMVAPDGSILDANQAALHMLGVEREALIGRKVSSLYTPESAERARTLFQRWRDGETLRDEELVLLAGDGTERTVLLSAAQVADDEGELLYSVSIQRDVTDQKRAEEERRRLEEKMLHAQKLESLGVLAGGIAHDFNNLLLAILGNADLAELDVPTTSPIRPNLVQIKEAAARAAELCNQMLAYSGKGRFVVQHLDLSEVVAEMTKMLEVSISKKASLRLHLAEHLPTVAADPTQLRQVVMNLLTNASDALEDETGSITVATGWMECDRAYLRETYLDDDLPAGLYVSIEVSDTGCGMDPDTQARLFDPFFSTKFTGRGLGLAAVLGIVRGHGGAIRVYSEPGRGSTFKILLPAAPGEEPAAVVRSVAVGGWRGTGTVILADDEGLVRQIGRTMLIRMGFEVLLARNGREAVDLFRRHRSRVVAVLLDLTMPTMDGEEAFQELRKVDPGVKVLMTSGYNEQDVTQRFVGRGLAGFIQKPYQYHSLQAKLQKILDIPGG